MSGLFRDIRYALRQLRKSPGFAAAVVLCLGIGIGANTMVFDVAQGTLRPLSSIDDPDRVVRIYTSWASGERFNSFCYPDYQDVRDRTASFESVATWSLGPCHLTIEGVPERTWGQSVSGNYFQTLGVDMAIGRPFLAEEDSTEGTHPVVILGHGLWQRRFGGSPDVLGSQVLINGYPFTVVGVAEKGFESGMVGAGSDLFVPMMMHEMTDPERTWFWERGSHWLQDVTARLKEGVSIEQARAEVVALMANLEEEYPDSNRGKSATVLPEDRASLHPMVRPGFVMALNLLGVVVGLLLLLTCANVAGLMLARAWTRRKEMGIRLALGAERGRIIRQVLMESILLALMAGVAAIAFAQVLTPITNSTQPQMDIPLRWPTGFNPMILWFAPLAALVAGLVFGIMPAVEISRSDVVRALATGRGTTERRAHRLRNLLVGAQVTASLVLLIGAGMVIRSAGRIGEVYPGFEPTRQIVATIDLGLQSYDEERGRAFFDELDRRLTALPGVEAAGRARTVPLTLSMSSTWARPEGYEGEEEDVSSIGVNYVDEDYFTAMGIPIVRGRAFEEADAEGEIRILANEALVQRFWPGEDGIGKRVDTGGPGGDLSEIVGVVPTGRYFSLGEDPTPHFYRYTGRDYMGAMTLHIRTAGDPRAHFADVQRVIREMDPDLPVTNLTTMEEQMKFALLPSRLIAWSVSIFAVLALLLASVGLYGLIAYSVTQRTRELGVRIAIGAQPGQVIRAVVGKAMILLGIGVGVGLVLGIGLATAMSSFLYGLSPVDPVAIGAALAVLATVTWLASWIPARRATRIDPMKALNAE